jgi:hypothetical protein
LTASLVTIGRRARILALKLKRIPQKEQNVPPVSRGFRDAISFFLLNHERNCITLFNKNIGGLPLLHMYLNPKEHARMAGVHQVVKLRFLVFYLTEYFQVVFTKEFGFAD